VHALGGALVRQACVASYSVGSFIIIGGAAGAAALLPGASTGVMPLEAAGALNSFWFVGDLV
jgi:hypothetical protein